MTSSNQNSQPMAMQSLAISPAVGVAKPLTISPQIATASPMIMTSNQEQSQEFGVAQPIIMTLELDDEQNINSDIMEYQN